MDLELTDVQQELGSTVARLLKTKYDAGTREALLATERGWSEGMTWEEVEPLEPREHKASRKPEFV